VARDHEADVARWQRLARQMAEGLAGIPGVEAIYHDGGERRLAGVRVKLDEQRLGITAVELVNRLSDGDPIIAVQQGGIDQGRFALGTMCLADGEEEIVIRRLREELTTRG
jgi:L-seryl-tRNA(Ser) seleniumtransferase/D-glucosaminate-6-phosphate ammonia-lyase